MLYVLLLALVAAIAVPAFYTLRVIAWYIFNSIMAWRFGPDVLDKTAQLRAPELPPPPRPELPKTVEGHNPESESRAT